MANYEYMFIPLNQILQEIIDHYNLHNIVHKGKVYVEIRRGMYGLPQAGILAETQLIHFFRQVWLFPCHPHTWTVAPSMATDRILPRRRQFWRKICGQRTC